MTIAVVFLLAAAYGVVAKWRNWKGWIGGAYRYGLAGLVGCMLYAVLLTGTVESFVLAYTLTGLIMLFIVLALGIRFGTFAYWLFIRANWPGRDQPSEWRKKES